MVKRTRTVALFIVLSMAAVSCQKETFFDVDGNAVEQSVSRKVSYMIDGVFYQATLHNDADWDALMHRLLTLAREGHHVVIAQGDSVTSLSMSKDVITFTTTSEEEANHWAEQMIQQGYSVSINFDDEAGEWKCIAYK